jgi:hypothetical protein
VKVDRLLIMAALPVRRKSYFSRSSSEAVTDSGCVFTIDLLRQPAPE